MKRFWLLPLLVLFILPSRYANAQCEVPNGDFEIWQEEVYQDIMGTDVTVEIPLPWISLDDLLNIVFGLGPNTVLKKTTDAQHGTYAAELITDIDSTVVDLTGVFACDEMPGSLRGYYKYNGDPDGAGITVGATRYLPGMDSIELVGAGSLGLTPTDVYREFVIPMTYAGVPDTMVIIIINSSINAGASLHVDNLHFGGSTPVRDRQLDQASIRLYPNPAWDQFTIESRDRSTELLQCSVFDLVGRSIYSDAFRGEATIHTKDWQPGLYTVRLTNEDGITLERKLIVR